MKIERPVKISYTKNHHEMLFMFISELWDCLEVSEYKHGDIPTLEHTGKLLLFQWAYDFHFTY